MTVAFYCCSQECSPLSHLALQWLIWHLHGFVLKLKSVKSSLLPDPGSDRAGDPEAAGQDREDEGTTGGHLPEV